MWVDFAEVDIWGVVMVKRSVARGREGVQGVFFIREVSLGAGC